MYLVCKNFKYHSCVSLWFDLNKLIYHGAYPECQECDLDDTELFLWTDKVQSPLYLIDWNFQSFIQSMCNDPITFNK